MNYLIPVKEADIQEFIKIIPDLLALNNKVILWNYMPHESALKQDEFYVLQEFCNCHNVTLIRTRDYDLQGCFAVKNELIANLDKYFISKAFFSCQWFSDGFFDRDYGPSLSLIEKRQIFDAYITLSIDIIENHAIDRVLCYEENTEFARSVLGVLSEELGFRYSTLRKFENQMWGVLEGYSSPRLHFGKDNVDLINWFYPGEFLAKRSLKSRVGAHIRDIYNTTRYSFSKLISSEATCLVGRPYKRIAKTFVYIYRDVMRRYSPVLKLSECDFILPLQTFPESASVVDTFPMISVVGLVENTAARLLYEGKLVVTLHPNTDYEIPLELQRKWSSIPNVEVIDSFSNQTTFGLASRFGCKLLCGSGNTGITGYLSGFPVVFIHQFWFTQLLHELKIPYVEINDIGLQYSWSPEIRLLIERHLKKCLRSTPIEALLND